MIITSLQVLRNGTPVSGLPIIPNCQLDTMNADPRAFDGGAGPFDFFAVYLPWPDQSNPILRQDQLQDAGPSNTGLYRVLSKPEYFPDHVELQAFQKVGT